jgi:predicted lipoprotein with Yx(FWY)xxD motif
MRWVWRRGDRRLAAPAHRARLDHTTLKEIHMTRLFSFAALAVAGALVLAACGGSSTSSSSGSGSTPSYGAPKPSTSNSSGAASVVRTQTTSLGTFLVDSNGRALYLWDADHGSKSTCSGACAQAWPPLTTTRTPKASGAVKASLLGTTKRGDGSREVTYAGHPLYTFAGDTQAGQTTGQGSNGFGAPWWVVTPAGKALQN